MSQQTVSFRIEQNIHSRLVSATDKLGLNASKVFRDALEEKLEELEELVIVSERLKQNRKRKPISELWSELGLEDNV